jgi:hypothetical protein
LLAIGIVLASGSSSPAGQLCRPHLAVKDAQLSEPRNLERTWTAVVTVDASRCAASSGRFDVNFVREKENAPELDFTEQFTWHRGELATGQIEVSIDIWIDEVVHWYSIGYVAPCGCRN